MKRILLCASALFFLATASFGQMAFKDNQNVASIGLGIGYFADMNIPPINFTLEHGINSNISLGGMIGYAGARHYYDDYYGYYYAYSNLLIGFRGSYHFDLFRDRKFDTYAGLLLGYDATWHSDEYGSYRGKYDGNYVVLGLHGGARYYFTPNVAFQLELGYNELYLLSAGLCFKL